VRQTQHVNHDLTDEGSNHIIPVHADAATALPAADLRNPLPEVQDLLHRVVTTGLARQRRLHLLEHGVAAHAERDDALQILYPGEIR
jgi:hypothetical protein